MIKRSFDMTAPVSADAGAAAALTRRGLLAAPAAAALVSAGPTLADTPSAIGGALGEPLGIGLEGWPYPGPVAFLPLTAGGEAVRMAYMDFAPSAAANGRVIVLLHGKNFDSSYWAGPITWLRAAGFRVVVPDQIGFNKSSKPDMDYTFEALAHNTMALVDALVPQARITVLGHSTGGALAVRLASIYAQRVEQLVLEDPIGLVDYRAYVPPQETATLVAAEHAYTVESYRAFIARYFPMLPPAQYEPFVTWRMRTTLSGEFDRFARASALTYQMIYREPTRPLYAGLSMPVLLTAGTRDKSAPLISYAAPEARARMPAIHEAGQAAVAELKSGRFVSFPGVGHVPHLEAPERFRSELLAFLRG